MAAREDRKSRAPETFPLRAPRCRPDMSAARALAAAGGLLVAASVFAQPPAPARAPETPAPPTAGRTADAPTTVAATQADTLTPTEGASTPAPAPAAPAATVSEEDAPRPPERLDFGALPLLNYNSDNGVGMGANAQIFKRSEGFRPYRYALKAQVFFTTVGLQDHSLSVDAPTFLGSQYRLSGVVGYHRELAAPFYGVTNFPELVAPAPPDAQHYTHFDYSTWKFNVKAQRLLGDFRVAAQYLMAAQTYRPYANSLLSEVRDEVARNGRVAELHGEVSYDTRNTEASAEHGIYTGVMLAVASPLLGGTWSYVGGEAWFQVYHSVFPKPYLVLAARVDGRYNIGDLPVTHLPAVGGSSTLRGVPGNQYLGPQSLVMNLEARSRVVRFRPGGHTLDFWLVGFVDTGRVWAPGDPQVDAPYFGLHASTGGGIRLAWEEDFIIRFDMGWSKGPSPRSYLDFGQVF